MVDGGMVSLSVVSKAGPDVKARVVDPGLILSRANLTFQRDGHIVRARNAMLPVLSSKVRRGLDHSGGSAGVAASTGHGQSCCVHSGSNAWTTRGCSTMQLPKLPASCAMVTFIA